MDTDLFHSSTQNSVRQFGSSFTFVAPTVWYAVPGENHVSFPMASFRKQKKLRSYLYTKACPTLVLIPPPPVLPIRIRNATTIIKNVLHFFSLSHNRYTYNNAF